MSSRATTRNIPQAGGSPVDLWSGTDVAGGSMAGSAGPRVPADDAKNDDDADDDAGDHDDDDGSYNYCGMALVAAIIWAKTVGRMIIPGDVHRLSVIF